MLFLNDKINFEDYRISYDSAKLKILELYFFNLATWYLLYDEESATFKYGISGKDKESELFSRAFNIATSYLQIFFDYPNLIEEYRIKYHGITYKQFHDDETLLNKRIPLLIRNNVLHVSNAYLEGFNYEDVDNGYNSLYAQKKIVGNTKSYLDVGYDPIQLFEYLKEYNQDPEEKNIYTGLKRIVLNQFKEYPDLGLFQGFTIIDNDKNSVEDYLHMKESYLDFFVMFHQRDIRELFNRLSLYMIQYDLLVLMNEQFTYKNEFTASLIVDGPTQALRDVTPFLLEFHKMTDKAKIAEMLNTIAWVIGDNGQPQKIGTKTIKRTLYREIENFE